MLLGFISVQTCKPQSSIKSECSQNLSKICTIINKRKMVYSSNSMVCFPFSCGNFQSHCLESVYGIVFLQLFGATTDSLNTFYTEAGGWGLPYILNPIITPPVVSAIDNLPTLIDALSKPRISLCSQIKTMCLTAGFSVQMFFTRRIFMFSRLYFGFKIKAILFAICVFTFLVSFPPYSHKLQF
jgi:hypothetical protein